MSGMETGFVFLDEAVRGIRWDAKYATWDNFTGRPIEGYEANRVVGSCELAQALRRARVLADDLGYGLLLWDGYRPQRAVDRMLRWSEEPEDGFTKGRYYPNTDRAGIVAQGYVVARSSHSRGSAVDLTLYRADTGALVAMGGGFDLMDERSHHAAKGVADGEMGNRYMLCHIMENSGFLPYEREWWHYTLADEPYPESYFDFAIA